MKFYSHPKKVSVEGWVAQAVVRVSELMNVTFKCPKELLRDVDLLAYELRMSRSQLIRNALAHYVDMTEKTRKTTKKKIIVKRVRLK